MRSHRRRKTVEAQEFGDTLRISIPASMSKTEEEHWVRVMVGRAQRWRAADRIDLEARARSLSARYGLPAPTSVVWAHNQKWRWGSCSPSDGSLRISSHLATMPTWVLDYVLVHEMAHLVVPEHGPEFWRLVNRYPRTERARGYLMAKSGE
ncbi:MAG TPA: M48 family metallopeptidase [Acidimicrobiales bacterium]|nr:M48 family metallopeptidase [Acidimicrobiales bacterium]